ncbi:MAG: peptidylprolyl isomerase [Clostridia bacterium]
MNYKESKTPTNLVKIEMTTGDEIIIMLDEINAPITVNNFKKLVSQSFYNRLIFHRVINGFMIQGGDPTGTGTGGSPNTIKGEFDSNGVPNKLSHTRGVISMARSQAPNSASSQFFICHKDSCFLDGLYASFGNVISGLDIVDKIAATPTHPNDKPKTEQIIKTISFLIEEK